MKQNKLGTFDLTQIAGGPLGNFAQQAPTWKKGGAAAEVIEILYIYIYTRKNSWIYIYTYVICIYIYYMNYDKYIFICIFMILVYHLYTIYVYHLQKIIQK